MLAACVLSSHAETYPVRSGIAVFRLLTPLSSSASRPGSSFKAIVSSPFTSGGQVIIPVGATINGTVLKRNAVGFGLVHERASLTLRFDSYELPDGRRLPMTGKLLGIENARESVNGKGQIRGILAADSPQGVLGGIWTRPSMISFPRSFIGLTGVAGGVWSHFAMGPIGAVSLLAVRCTMFHMPDPEIQLPAGTELDAEVDSFPDDAPRFESAVSAEVPDSLAEALGDQDYQLAKPDGKSVRDIINLAFIGSRETLVAAFQGAGWTEAQPLSNRSKYRMLGAYIAQKGYSEAPASKLVYQGEKPDLVIEKSFNDIMKRDHVRIWRTEIDGREVWLGAATRDNGVGFNPHALSFTHRIQPNIDSEREKITGDLVFAGCSDSAGFVDRPEIVEAHESNVITDGRLAVLELRPCTALTDTAEIGKTTPTGNVASRLARRLILEGRQYAERESAVYWAYRVMRWTYKGVRKG